MAFMMPVVKNDWDIYNSRRSSESAEKATPGGGRVRKVSESRSEGPAFSRSGTGTLSPHRSAPAMRSLSYCRPPPSRVSLRSAETGKGPASSATSAASKPREDKFHSRFVEKLKRALGRADSRTAERSS